MTLDEEHTLTGAGHPVTSAQAAARILGRTGTVRRLVMEAIAELPRTDEELQWDLMVAANTQRPRRVELVGWGLVVATNERRRTRTGAASIVWAATDLGRDALARPAEDG